MTAPQTPDAPQTPPAPQLISVPTFVDGQFMHQGQLAVLPWDIDQLALILMGKAAAARPTGKPLCKVLLNGSQSIPSGNAGTNAIVTWGVEAADTDGMFSGGGTTSGNHVTIRTPGWYKIYASAYWATGPPSERVVQILVNGVADPANVCASSNALPGQAGIHRQQVFAREHLAAGATVYCGVFQNSGSALNLLPNGLWGTHMTVAYDAPL